MKKRYFPKDKFLLQLSAVLLLLILIPIFVTALIKGNYLNYSFARSKTPICDSIGGKCMKSKPCLDKDRYNLDSQDCRNNKICCLIGELPTPTPLPKLEYQGENINVTAECMASGSINISIIDYSLLDTNPNGIWTYLYTGMDEYSYLAYTGPSGANCSVVVYGATNPIRGERILVEDNTYYTAGFAHGEYTVIEPTLVSPRYELNFLTPTCN